MFPEVISSCVIVLLLLAYKFIKRRHRYWLDRKIAYLPPENFLFGDFARILFTPESLYEHHANLYKRFKTSDKLGGYFSFLRPTLMILDPEIIKRVLVKDFSHFMDRRLYDAPDNGPLAEDHIFNMFGERWRSTRQKLTPIFTSEKLKSMFPYMTRWSEELIRAIDETISLRAGEPVEIKDFLRRYTIDIVSDCALGLNANSLEDPESSINVASRELFEFGIETRAAACIAWVYPRLRELLRVKVLGKKIRLFFMSTIKQAIKYREESDVPRNDFLSFFIALKNDSTKNEMEKFRFTENLVIAQCFLFFTAGFEAPSNVLTFALYELARNERVQSKLFREIDDAFKEDQNAEITYSWLANLKYLDQVVNEAMRLHPTAPFLPRVCTEPYRISENYVVEKGTRIIIPVLGLHSDPKYYDNPTEFIPERFSDEVKHKINPYTFFPFGEGPRKCIAMRFGLAMVKLGIMTLIRRYEVSLDPSKMEDTLKFRKDSIFGDIAGGTWLNIKKRS